MAKLPSIKPETPDPIQRVIDLLLSEVRQHAPQPTPDKSTQSVPVPRKGRRYSPSEKAAILSEEAEGKSRSELCSRYGVCRETISRWKLRAEKADSRKKKTEAASSKASPEPDAPEVKDTHRGYHAHWREVLKLWRARPGLGPAQIKNQLRRAGIKITVSTTRKILEENGYTPPKAAVKEIEINRYEAVRPLELVHMDFKHFYINRAKVYLLLLQDDYSRFLCGFRMTDSENMKAVTGAFEECVSRYGKMQAVMTDAGSAFYSWNGINRFQKLLSSEYGVDQIKARSPRSNGKIENVNKQIEKEVLDVKRYASLEEAHAAIEAWIRFYNFERTHMGLPEAMVPADRFLYGWNQGEGERAQAPTTAPTPASIEQAAWTEVVRLALTRLKRAA